MFRFKLISPETINVKHNLFCGPKQLKYMDSCIVLKEVKVWSATALIIFCYFKAMFRDVQLTAEEN